MAAPHILLPGATSYRNGSTTTPSVCQLDRCRHLASACLENALPGANPRENFVTAFRGSIPKVEAVYLESCRSARIDSIRFERPCFSDGCLLHWEKKTKNKRIEGKASMKKPIKNLESVTYALFSFNSTKGSDYSILIMQLDSQV